MHIIAKMQRIFNQSSRLSVQVDILSTVLVSKNENNLCIGQVLFDATKQGQIGGDYLVHERQAEEESLRAFTHL